MGVSRSDECAERVMAIVQPRYLVKLAVAGAVLTQRHFRLAYKRVFYRPLTLSHCFRQFNDIHYTLTVNTFYT